MPDRVRKKRLASTRSKRDGRDEICAKTPKVRVGTDADLTGACLASLVDDDFPEWLLSQKGTIARYIDLESGTAAFTCDGSSRIAGSPAAGGRFGGRASDSRRLRAVSFCAKTPNVRVGTDADLAGAGLAGLVDDDFPEWLLSQKGTIAGDIDLEI